MQAPSAARGSQAFKIRLRGCRLMGVCLDTVPTACNAGMGPAGLRNRARGIAREESRERNRGCESRSERCLVFGSGDRKRGSAGLPGAGELGQAGLREDFHIWETNLIRWTGAWGPAAWVCVPTLPLMKHVRPGELHLVESSSLCQMGVNVAPASEGCCEH